MSRIVCSFTNTLKEVYSVIRISKEEYHFVEVTSKGVRLTIMSRPQAMKEYRNKVSLYSKRGYCMSIYSRK